MECFSEISDLDIKQSIDSYFQNLPEEILEEIFKYLSHKDLCRVGGVCRKFHVIARSPVFWKRVAVHFNHESMEKAVMGFLDALPNYVTHLALNCGFGWTINLRNFLEKLGKNCPYLAVLFFYNATLSSPTDYFRSDACLREQHLHNIKALIFYDCALMNGLFRYNETFFLSQVRIIHISRCVIFKNGTCLNADMFIPMLPYLKKLRCVHMELDYRKFLTEPFRISHLEILDLEKSRMQQPEVIDAIRTFGIHLKELYLAYNYIVDEDITFKTGFLPCLKIICLRGCFVTGKGIKSLIRSCPSLQTIYAGPFPDAQDYLKCDPKIVKLVRQLEDCNHDVEHDYMNM